jgi:hypothetical protein
LLPTRGPADLEFIDLLRDQAVAPAFDGRNIYWREMRARQHLPIDYAR